MLPIQIRECYEHEQCVEDVKKGFMRHDVAFSSLTVFHHSHQVPYHDEHAGDVQGFDEAAPAETDSWREGSRRRAVTHAVVESTRDDHEEGEDGELKDEAEDGKRFAGGGKDGRYVRVESSHGAEATSFSAIERALVS